MNNKKIINDSSSELELNNDVPNLVKPSWEENKFLYIAFYKDDENYCNLSKLPLEIITKIASYNNIFKLIKSRNGSDIFINITNEEISQFNFKGIKFKKI